MSVRLISAILMLLPFAAYADSPTSETAIDTNNLLERCEITAKQNISGRPTFYNKAGVKGTIVETAVRNLKNVDFRFGHTYAQPSVSFENGNKFGIYALALGFFPFDTIKKCSSNPQDYEAVFICRGVVPGVGVGAGESGSLDCSMNAKAATEHDFCIIGFTPEFESTGAGLAKAMDALGMCEEQP